MGCHRQQRRCSWQTQLEWSCLASDSGVDPSSSPPQMSASIQRCAPLLPSLKSVARDVASAAQSSAKRTPVSASDSPVQPDMDALLWTHRHRWFLHILEQEHSLFLLEHSNSFVCACVHVSHVMCIPQWCVQSPKDLQYKAEEEVDGAGSADSTARELQQASKAMQTALEEAQRRATKLEEVRFVSAFLAATYL